VRFSKPTIVDTGSYSVQLYEDVTGVQFFIPQCSSVYGSMQ